jgi:hypothetical protein
MTPFSERTLQVDFCVVGGGLAGLCAAVAAARNGIQVALVHDRPMLGGNASSEIRMWISGAKGRGFRETGILEEIHLRNFYRNPYKNYSIWDSILYEIVKEEPNIQLFLNTTCFDGKSEENRLLSVRCWQMTTQTYYTIESPLFADCSGDSILAPLAGAWFRHGREAKATYSESFGPDCDDSHTMGSSILIQGRECNEKKSFIAPDWADSLSLEMLHKRVPDLKDPAENFWYLELGGDQDTIADAECIRDDLLALAYGMWDFVKNDPSQSKKNEKFDLDWVGFLPGKRESRRYVGDYTLTERDITKQVQFADVVAYGGWPMDDHQSRGFRASEEEPNVFHHAPSPYSIPYRCLYSKNINNLFFAGRNISVSHAAFSSTRVMATCALLGQAVGTAAALCGSTTRSIDVAELQQRLLDQDCFLPHCSRRISDLSMKASLASTQPRNIECVRGGDDRQEGWKGTSGDRITYTMKKPETIQEIRLIFDSDLERTTLPQDGLCRNMGSNYLRSYQMQYVPKTLVKSFKLTLRKESGEIETLAFSRNIKRYVSIPVRRDSIREVTLTLLTTWGEEVCSVISFEVR